MKNMHIKQSQFEDYSLKMYTIDACYFPTQVGILMDFLTTLTSKTRMIDEIDFRD